MPRWPIDPPSRLSHLEDADTAGASDGDVLTYDDGTSKWVPGVGGGGGSGSNAAYSETIGDGSATSYQVTHSLGTQDLVVQLWDLTGAEPVEATGDASQIEIDDDNNITVTFGSAPAIDSYRVVIVADGGSSGGGGGGNVYHAAAIPDSPAGFDEEFDTDPTASWTWLNQSTASAVVDTDAEALTLSDDRNANNASFIGKAPPAGDWTIETLSYPWIAAQGSNRHGGFLAVRYGSTIEVVGVYLLRQVRTLVFGSNGSANVAPKSSTNKDVTQAGPIFLRASWDDTAGTLTWTVSQSGAEGSWFEVDSHSPGSTPDLVGFAGIWQQSHLIGYTFEYLRLV